MDKIVCYKDIDHPIVERVEVLQLLPQEKARIRIIKKNMEILEVTCDREVVVAMYRGDFSSYNL